MTQLLYTRLQISLQDFLYAQRFVEFLIQKGWHFEPSEKKRGSTYLQQSAFTTAAIIFYSRPFTLSIGLPRFPEHLTSSYDEADSQFHQMVLGLRNQVYAHSDASRYEILPLEIGGEAAAIFLEAPFFRLTLGEARQLQKMLLGVIGATTRELQGLISKLSE